MKTIRILTIGPLYDAPLTFLANAQLKYFDGWSTKGGVSGPLYRTPEGRYQVLPPEWSEDDAQVFANMMGATTTRVDLPDEEADAIITRLNSNITGRTPS